MMSFDFSKRNILTLDSPVVDFQGDLYRASRYLAGASSAELLARLEGLAAGILKYTASGEPHFTLPNSVQGMAFIDLWHEFGLRNLDLNVELAARLDKWVGIITTEEIRKLTEFSEQYRGRKVIFKFMKKEHGDLLVSGSVRFTNATTYADARLPVAIQDDELEIRHQLAGLKIITRSGEEIPIKEGRIASRASGPYYISSFTQNCRIQYFPLFGATCCVAIENAEEFDARVRASYERRYPGEVVFFSKVEYIDQFRRLKCRSPIEFRKSSNYEFEEEWRFAAWSRLEGSPTEVSRTIAIDPRGLKIEKFEIGMRIKPAVGADVSALRAPAPLNGALGGLASSLDVHDI